MSGLIAIGIGCRKNCSASAIAALVHDALSRIKLPESHMRKLFSLIDKQDEAGLFEAARQLDLPLQLLPRAALIEVMGAVQTHSAKALRLYGLESVSEAAALAGAGAGGELIVHRLSAAGATCAIAFNPQGNLS